jgi:hypothetical protein
MDDESPVLSGKAGIRSSSSRGAGKRQIPKAKIALVYSKAIKRAKERKISGLKAAWEKANSSDWDLQKSLKRAEEEIHHDNLNDEEWKHVKAAICRAGITDFNEENIRAIIDSISSTSGYFSNWRMWSGTTTLSLSSDVQECDDLLKVLKKVVKPLKAFIGVEIEGGTDNYDPHENFRAFEPYLNDLIRHINHTRNHHLERKKTANKPPANRKVKPEIERWMAGLVRVWVETLGLPLKNGVHLQGFILACLAPYGLGISTEKQVKDFLTKYMRAEVAKVQATYIE